MISSLIRRQLLIVIVLLAVLSLVVAPGPTPAPAATPAVSVKLVPLHGAWFGDYVGSNPADVPAREALSRRKFDLVSFYHDWNDAFPTAGEKTLAAGGRFLKLNFTSRDYSNDANNKNWCQVANGGQDTNIRRIAGNVKSFGRRLFLSFSIEPEGRDGASCTGRTGTVGGYGTLAQFARAWRHIHNVFAARGVTNVVWVVTYANPGAATAAAAYPGDAYTDWIGWDPYNWYRCGGHNDPWTQLASKMASFYGWAQLNHPGKWLMLGEYGSAQPGASTPSKGTWFRNVPDQVARYRPKVKAFIMFDRFANGSCNWKVDSSADSLDGWRDMGRAAYFHQPHA